MNTDLLISDGQAEATLKYLSRYATFDNDTPDDHLPDAMVASFAQTCVWLRDPAAPRAEAAAAAAERAAALLRSHPRRGTLDLDPLLMVVHYQMLVDHHCAVLNFASLIGEIATMYRQLPAASRATPRIRYLGRLLSDAGLMDGAHDGRPAFGEDASLLLALTPDELIAQTESALASGEKVDSENLTILSILALAELRDYRVDFAARLLRFVVSQDHFDDYVAEALMFIALQRTRVGSYGFVDPLLETGVDPDLRERKFRLPVTLHAVWLQKIIGERIAGLRQGVASAEFRP